MDTKYKLNSIFLSCCFIFALFMSACSSEIETMEPEKQQGISINDNDLHVLQSLGFDTSNIVELESYYLIQGDILFEKSKLSSYDNAQTRQAYHTTGLIAYPKQSTITVGIDSSIPTSGVDNWREEILEAINLWNPLSNLKMTYTTDANPDILVRSDASNPLPYYAIAAAEFPMNGQPGSSIRINLDYDYNKTIPRLQKIYNIVHELGHCFGLRHTNWQSLNEPTANHINGTSSSDSNSVLNGGTAESSWKGFSSDDKYAISKLYPRFSASFIGFPDYIKNFGKDKSYISVSCSHPITSYSWTVTAGNIINSQGDLVISDNRSSVTVIFGSPITSAISVYITTIYNEKYYLGKDYQTKTFTLKRLE